ncbi:DUF2470 domain-containing protein [Herbiconiux sp. L3-i23]|uniref:DUF2470 domain-containing protein n=1 Tax=Herbiconiux sp. L3-i23 TaxID=2905871 RepID=UPI00205C50FB|nr:DUF2470 domain-containing protein [Herbiconiux sp. L3-i23]BDI24162.1 hypothetical protein L3i23_29380 [Herbiconiux sp. L3-i23]
MHTFPDDVVTAVLRHMNDDHNDDSLVIVRANGAPDASRARMTRIDGEAGTWVVTTPKGERELRVAWSTPITKRAEIRREIVLLHEEALIS